MRIMLLSDVADKALWDYLDRRLLEGIDLILSCGDLPAEYLSFLTCFTDAPILYVHGNHDKRYDQTPPEGCICVDDDIYVFQGVRILGLGGSMRYRPNEPYMYSEREMAARVRRLWLKLRRNKGFDILLAHAPAAGQGDLEDLPHRGFKTFVKLMDRYHPRYMAYGHVHQEYGALHFTRERKYGETTLVNAYKRYVIEI
ncbi:MAG: metallophosphoesterase family protein [Clostridia bacterium]|nr:metallophosphoesterase family protein [Clostridia bacterium]